MKKLLLSSGVFLLLSFGLSVAWAELDTLVNRFAAVRFARLPDGVRFPEGITANPHTGEIIVGTFDFGPNANKLLRFDRIGRLVAQRDFGATPLLGLAFNPHDRKIYICNVGDLATGNPELAKIQRIEADFDETTPIEDVAVIPRIGAPPNRTVGNPDGSQDTITFGNNLQAPNALVFTANGDLFVSDSFQGAIFRINNVASCPPCPVATVKHDSLLATAGFPPFGANGLALGSDGTTLFIANTGDDRVLRTNITSGNVSGDITIFAESINGADGIAFDDEGRLWVVANQADEVAVLNASGRVIAKFGDFLGIQSDGSPRGLLFPASLVIVRGNVFVTNLALPLTGATGDEPEEDVTRFTISLIPGQLLD